MRNAQDRLQRADQRSRTARRPRTSELIPRDRLVLTMPRRSMPRTPRQPRCRTRPEINQAFLQLRAATIREKMQRNELLPELNLVLQGSLGGLDGGRLTAAPTARQYNTGGPGYGAGFVFSFPLENNIARARLERRRLELRQQIDQLRRPSTRCCSR